MSDFVDAYYDLDKIKADLCEKHEFKDQDFKVSEYFEKYPANTWKDAVKACAGELFEELEDVITEDLEKNEAEKLSS